MPGPGFGDRGPVRSIVHVVRHDDGQTHAGEAHEDLRLDGELHLVRSCRDLAAWSPQRSPGPRAGARQRPALRDSPAFRVKAVAGAMFIGSTD